MNNIPRRRVLGLAIGGIVVAGVAGGVALFTHFEQAPVGSATAHQASSGPWTFTDDRGITVSLPSRPRRIVAYDLAASALMHLGLMPVGIFATYPFSQNPQLSGFDLSHVAKVAESYGQINFETLAAIAPDLIVTVFYPNYAGAEMGFKDKAQQTEAEQFAPTIAFNALHDLTTVIGRFEQLGSSLGIDLKGQRVTTAHQQFAAVSARLHAATAAKPGLTALVIAAEPGLGIQVARPESDSTLQLYEKLGLHLIHPTSPPQNINQNPNGFFYELNSFEQVGRYPADLILYSNLPGAMTLQQLATIPTWQILPAVKARQLVPWQQLDPYSYELLNQRMTAIASAVEQAKMVKGS